MRRRVLFPAAIASAFALAWSILPVPAAHAMPPAAGMAAPAKPVEKRVNKKSDKKTDKQVTRRTKADFGGDYPRTDVRDVANWAVRSNDYGSGAFFILDKPRARLFVFNPAGRLVGSTQVLLGLARGDDSVPGIGEKELADITQDERTTPAGRFVAERGVNATGEDVVWVDYAAAVSLHRVRPLSKDERRLQRLATPTWTDNRVSYGCINVPVAFYNTVVQRAWNAGGVVVYVLPDTRPLDVVLPRPRTFVDAAALLRRSG